MLKVIYVLFLGIVLAIFIGLGIEAFYPTEKYPEYPSEIQYSTEPLTKDQKKIQKDFDAKTKAYQEREGKHSRNVSMIAIAASIIFMILSLTVLSKAAIISDGFLLGGLLTLLYSIIRGFISPDNIFRFLLVTAGLIVALILGYIKFIKNEKPIKTH